MSERDWVLLPDGITWRNEGQGLQAYVKWDGCSHLWFEIDPGNLHTQNGKKTCYHHICDIDHFIATMQSLRAHVAQKFDQDIEAMGPDERKGLTMPFHREEEQ